MSRHFLLLMCDPSEKSLAKGYKSNKNKKGYGYLSGKMFPGV